MLAPASLLLFSGAHAMTSLRLVVANADPARVGRSARGEPAARGFVGDAASFDALFRAHYSGLCRFVCRMVRDRDAAEELVQDLFLRVCQREAAGGPAAVTRAYLYAAARNLALNHLKHQRIADAWSAREAAEHEEDAPGIDFEGDGRELARVARSAVASLPDRGRQVFLLNRQQQLTYDEIARALGISVKTVETHMVRALRALRAALVAHTAPIAVVVAGGLAVWGGGSG